MDLVPVGSTRVAEAIDGIQTGDSMIQHDGDGEGEGELEAARRSSTQLEPVRASSLARLAAPLGDGPITPSRYLVDLRTPLAVVPSSCQPCGGRSTWSQSQ